MHEIEPYFNWVKYYDSAVDELSPFYGKEYNYDVYKDAIYNYFIDPAWDYIGSETLYIKILYADYEAGFVVIELLGEWNDAISNDIMHLKRNILDHMILQGLKKFVLIGENVLNFHGSDDSYYEEWFDDVEEGWVAAINFRDFVLEEWKKYHVDYYINFGGNLQIDRWRTLNPQEFCRIVNHIVRTRIELT